MSYITRLFAALSLALISLAAHAWTSIVSGPYVEGPPGHFRHVFYGSGAWPNKYASQNQALQDCFSKNTAEYEKQCEPIADYDGPVVIALVSAQNRYWAAVPDRDTDTAVKKAFSLCHRDGAEDCKLTEIYWDFGHNLLDAPESFKQLYMKLHGGTYWQPPSGYWFP